MSIKFPTLPKRPTKLYAPSSYWEASAQERAKICNGRNMIIPIKQIILEEGFFAKVKPFNVGPNMGQKFLSNVSSHTKAEIQKTKARIKQLDFEASVNRKLDELRARPGFGDISSPTNPTPIQQPQTKSSQPAATFNSTKIRPRDINNPYNRYIEIYKNA